jgi:hypothetical protein
MPISHGVCRLLRTHARTRRRSNHESRVSKHAQPSGQRLRALKPDRLLVTNQPKVNFGLEEGDVIHVPKSTLANAGYTMRQLLPGLSFMTFGLTAGGSK